MKIIILFLFTTQFIWADELPSCESKKVYFKTYVEQLSRVDTKVVTKKILVDLNPEWSIHAGKFEELVVVSNEKKQFSKVVFKFVNFKRQKITKEVKVFLTQNQFISLNNKLDDLMTPWVANGPGDIEAILISDNKKPYCVFKINVVRGD